MVGATVVGVLQFFDCLLFRLVVFHGGALQLAVVVSVDKHLEAVLEIAQHVVGTTSDNDARLFRCQLADDAALCHEQCIVLRKAVFQRNGIVLHNHFVEQAARNVLFARLNKIGAQAFAFCRHVDEFAVVERNAEMLCQLLSDFPSATAVFACNGDDEMSVVGRDGFRFASGRRISGQIAVDECQTAVEIAGKHSHDDSRNDGAFAHSHDFAVEQQRHDDGRYHQ